MVVVDVVVVVAAAVAVVGDSCEEGGLVRV